MTSILFLCKFIFLVVVIISCIVCFICIIRNNIICKYRTKALNIISCKVGIAMDENRNWKKYYERLENYGTYNQMFFNILKWRFKDFYPNI